MLVVGAGPSGQQIAAELRRAGRRVVLAAGSHVRLPRRYLGRDIWNWLDRLGDVDREVTDAARATAAGGSSPSLALTGANGGEDLDLGVLHALGIVVTGRLARFDRGRAVFGDDLADIVADADQRMRHVLDRVDAHVVSRGDDVDTARGRVEDVQLPPGPRELDLARAGITTIVWATGYRRDYSWLNVPVLDDAGEIVHRRGVTRVPGLYALGLKFQHRRSSHQISGVGRDARFLAAHIAGVRPLADRRDRDETLREAA